MELSLFFINPLKCVGKCELVYRMIFSVFGLVVFVELHLFVKKKKWTSKLEDESFFICFFLFFSLLLKFCFSTFICGNLTLFNCYLFGKESQLSWPPWSSNFCFLYMCYFFMVFTMFCPMTLHYWGPNNYIIC